MVFSERSYQQRNGTVAPVDVANPPARAAVVDEHLDPRAHLVREVAEVCQGVGQVLHCAPGAGGGVAALGEHVLPFHEDVRHKDVLEEVGRIDHRFALVPF